MLVFAWILTGLVGFAFLLAVQMRLLISVSMRRALAQEFGGDYRDAVHKASVQATRLEAPEDTGAAWLLETFPHPVAHLRLARRVSYTAPMALFLLLAYLRLGLKAF
ncbi:MAG: hypothetical protein R3B98_01975 [Hyphomonas sp.]